MQRGGRVRTRSLTCSGALILSMASTAMLLATTSARALETASADPSGSPEHPGTATTLPEVVVTAQKRGENLQKVPLAITAVTGLELEKAGVTDATGLTAVVPGLQVGTYGSSTEFTIRGVTSNTDPNLGDSPTAFHIDGIYQGRPGAASGLFYDLARAEVLNGPQGTLYGKDSTGGTINIITNKPNFHGLSGQVTEEIGDYGRYRTEAMINVPLSSTLAFRGALQTDRHTGYLASGYDDADDIAGRVHLLWRPNPNFFALLSQDYFHQGGVGNGQIPIPQAGDYWLKDPWSVKNTELQNEGAGGLNGRTNNLSAQTSLLLNWTFPYFDLTSISAYHHLSLDADSFLNGTPSLQKETDNEISQEVRLTSPAKERVKWALGFYYHREQQTNDLWFYNQAGPGVDSVQIFPKIDTPSYAVYGQLTYPILQDLNITGGLRWSNDQKTVQGTIAQYNYLVTDYNGPIVDRTTLVPPGIVPQAAPNGSLSASRVTWRIGMDKQLSPSSMVYFNVSTGYKQGGLDASAPPNNVYAPETITAYEVGAKNRFFGDRLQLNVDAFYYDYKGYQVDQLEFFPGQFGTLVFGDFITNAAGAKNEGVEVEAKAAPTKYDTISLNVAYLDAVFTNFKYPNPADPANPSSTFTYSDLSGYTEFSAPRWSGTLSYQHVWRLPNDTQLAFFALSHFQTYTWLTPNHQSDSRQPGYTKTEVVLQYTSPGGKYSVEAYGRNLENRAVYNNYTFQGPPPAHNYATIDPPRTYGAALKVQF